MMSLMTPEDVYEQANEVTKGDHVKLTPAGAEFRVLRVTGSETAGIEREILIRRLDNGTDLRVEVLTSKSVRFRERWEERWSTSTTRATWIGINTDGPETSSSGAYNRIIEGLKA